MSKDLPENADWENTAERTSRTGMSEERWEYLKGVKNKGTNRYVHVSKYVGQKHAGSTYVKKKEIKTPTKAM